MRFHAVAGLPRSGSTMLCNLLNQNPAFRASSTSCLPQTLSAMSGVWSNSPEVKSDLINDKERAEAKLARAQGSVIRAWYDSPDLTVFDKSRAWNHMAAALGYLWPRARILVCVRDLRAVFASIEKQNAKNPTLTHGAGPLDDTQEARLTNMFGPQGMVGHCVLGIEDMIRREPQNVVFVQYEHLVRDPEAAMRRIYAQIEEPYHPHDFDNVEPAANDVDALYLNKFPHDGSGKVEARAPDFTGVGPDALAWIMQRFPFFNQRFGYNQ